MVVLTVLVFIVGLISTTNALEVGIVLTWGTPTHVQPLFDALRPFASTSDNQVTFFGRPENIHYTKESPWITKTLEIPDSCQVQGYDAILGAVTQIEEYVDNIGMFAKLFRIIHDCYEPSVVAYIKLFRSKRLDLVLCDFFDRACMDAAKATNTTLAISAPLGIYGVGTDWFVPDIFAPAPIEEWVTSPWQRAKAVWNMAPFIVAMIGEGSRIQAVQQRLELGIPFVEPFDYLQKHLVLAHNLIGLEPARSLPNNIIPFGPIVHKDVLPPLEAELASSLDALHERGTRVIYVSFGSMIDATATPGFYVKLGAAIENLLADGIKVQGFDSVAVVWASKRHDNELVEKLSTKYKGRFFAPQWVSQRRLLMHNAVIAMVSHGGYGSVAEAVLAGKPLLLVPFYGDQFVNAVNAEDVGIAVQLDKYSLQSTDVVSGLTQLLDNKNLPKSLGRLQTIAHINSETSPVVVSSAVRLASTVGVDHLIPQGVYLNILHRFPPLLIALAAALLWLLVRAVLITFRNCPCCRRRATEANKDKRA